MFSVKAIVFVSAVLALPSLALKVRDPCPFGYGTGCGGVDPSPASMDVSTGAAPAGGKVDKATRDKVADILGGILTKMSAHNDLVQVKRSLAKVAVGEQSSAQVSSMSKEVADAIRNMGFLEQLQSTKQAAAGKALARLLAQSSSPDVACQYYNVCGLAPDQPIDSQTKEQVASILGGILSNLEHHKVF